MLRNPYLSELLADFFVPWLHKNVAIENVAGEKRKGCTQPSITSVYCTSSS